MQPDEIEVFENEDIRLTVHQFYAPVRNMYWVTAGAGALQFSEHQLRLLHQMLDEYYTFDPKPKRRRRK